jgi:hypothetical protein
MKTYFTRGAFAFCCMLLLTLNLGGCGNSGPSGVSSPSEKTIVSNLALDLRAGANAVQPPKPAKSESKLDPLPDDKPVKLFTFAKRALKDKDRLATKGYQARLKLGAPLLPINVDAEKLLELLLRGGMLSVEVPGAEEFKVRITPKPRGEGNDGTGMYTEFQITPADPMKNPVTVKVGFSTNGSYAGGEVEINDREFQFLSESKDADTVLIELDAWILTDFHGGRPAPHAPPVPQKEKLLNDKLPNDKSPVLSPKSLIEKNISGANIRIGFATTQTARAAVSSIDLEQQISRAIQYLQLAFTNSQISVSISRVTGVHQTEYSDVQKLAEPALRELNSLSTLPSDLATFRFNNDIDILVVLLGPQSSRGVSNDSGGAALIGGGASQSTIVIITDTFTTRDVLSHEIGHLLGADHHTLQRSDTVNDRSPFYGHITPQEPEFSGQRPKIDIMVDTGQSLSSCNGALPPCERVAIFSDPSFLARTSNIIATGVVNNPGCASAFPFPATLPCGGNADLCLTNNNCPYPLAFGYCWNAITVYKFGQSSAIGQSCYPKSVLFANAIRVPQYLGVANQSNVASLWKGQRPLEISTFSDQLKPQLMSTTAARIQVAFAGTLFD